MTFHRTEPAHLAVVVDQSSSMQTIDQQQRRSDQVLSILQNLNQWNSPYQISYWGFSNHLVSLNQSFLFDSLQFNEPLTNLNEVVRPASNAWKQNDVDAVLLFSDGIHNWGNSPLSGKAQSSIPIHTIRLGSEEESPDLIITKVVYPNIIFANQEIPVEVFIRGPGYSDQHIQVQLNSRLIQSQNKELKIAPKGLETSVKFNARFSQVGRHAITISVPQMTGESNQNNNQQTFVLDVLKGRYKVLLMGAQPHPDLAALHRWLKDSEMIDLTMRTMKTTSTFYEGRWLSAEQLSEMDVLILFNLPNQKIGQTLWNDIVHLVVNQKKSVFLIGGANISLSRLQPLLGILPFNNPVYGSSQMVQPRLESQNSFHPLMQSGGDVSFSIESWLELPPIYSHWKKVQLKSESQVLMYGTSLTNKSNTYIPLITLRHFKDEKAIAFLGEGLNRWQLLAAGIGESNPPFQYFLINSIRWLSLKDEIKPVRMTLQKSIYNAGEFIRITMNVNNAQYRPMNDANVELKIVEHRKQQILPVRRVEDGIYISEFQRFQNGPCHLKLNAFLDGNLLGEDSVTLDIKSYQPELIQTRANHQLLQDISQKTGGFSATPDSVLFLLEKLEYPDKVYDEIKHLSFQFSPWILIFIVLLLSIEWTIRKRKGML